MKVASDIIYECGSERLGVRAVNAVQVTELACGNAQQTQSRAAYKMVATTAFRQRVLYFVALGCIYEQSIDVVSFTRFPIRHFAGWNVVCVPQLPRQRLVRCS